MFSSTTKNRYLLQVGFVQLALYRSWDYPVGHTEAAFIPVTDVRYQYHLPAQDGTQLYAYSWVQEPGYLLSTARHISAFEHIVAEIENDDLLSLQLHVEQFFRQHGGVATPASAPAPAVLYWS
ncbi:hypothetical protein HNQ93_003923 [Hymenobacter luteus]|uniref:Uncharacterized protein n=2 Tax=Hymenobacter TaxID=89966 RepID=A0A7W9T3W2_9BACT|nr:MULTISPECIES: hypothetical protein [Hymenobacter]MBB4603397.1 hypothetical protein [Hymenobacter latericoloratus]MBB6061045.1 hypothetical protein [Hymenobacter luteus]